MARQQQLPMVATGKLAWLVVALSAQCAMSTDYPLNVSNCGEKHTYQGPPARAVTLNQGATEVMLALGLEDRMAATAYKDDVIDKRWKEQYESIPVEFHRYPEHQMLEALAPDFLYGSYTSAFESSRINYTEFEAVTVTKCSLVYQHSSKGELRSCRPDLHAADIGTYLQEGACEDKDKVVKTTVETVYSEIRTIASIFDVDEKGEEVIREMETDFKLVDDLMVNWDGDQPLRALWLDSWDDEAPFVGSCCGSPALILEEAGLENIAKDLGRDENANWKSMPWEDIVVEDPDVIVLIDANWDTAASKVELLCNASHPSAQLTAVKQHKLITIPFSASTMGVKVGKSAVNLAVAALYENGAIDESVSNKNFKTVEEAREGYRMALTDSGMGIFLTLPEELHETCPLSTLTSSTGANQDQSSNEGLTDGANQDQSSNEGLTDGAIAGICVASIVGGISVIVLCLFAWHHITFRKKYNAFVNQNRDPVMHNNQAHGIKESDSQA